MIEANYDLSEKEFDLAYKDETIIYLQNVFIIMDKFDLFEVDKKFIVKERSTKVNFISSRNKK